MVCLILLDLPSPSFDVLEQPVLLLSVYSALINYEKLHDPNPNPDPNTNPKVVSELDYLENEYKNLMRLGGLLPALDPDNPLEVRLGIALGASAGIGHGQPSCGAVRVRVRVWDRGTGIV